ncbi:SulA-like leucine-rich domain-containing protein [Oceanobacter mangrovi]|uniref:SulA-like leucine-rich domain-containing protein n=1 Tax=Oceanobacter mangrovi TaxID=2862510 RepID=UPI001C8D88F2|nr:SulA-like leucine-rich domain-containing protein [Oceanobacter mangrovi]
MRQLSLQVDQPALPLSSRIESSRVNRPAQSQGSLTEVIVSDNSAIQPLHLLPMLAHCNASKRWLMWLSPNRTLNKRWLESMALQKAPVVHIDLCADTQQQLCQRILEQGNSHLIIEWQGKVDPTSRNRLRKLAHESGSHVVLVHRG